MAFLKDDVLMARLNNVLWFDVNTFVLKLDLKTGFFMFS